MKRVENTNLIAPKQLGTALRNVNGAEGKTEEKTDKVELGTSSTQDKVTYINLFTVPLLPQPKLEGVQDWLNMPAEARDLEFAEMAAKVLFELKATGINNPKDIATLNQLLQEEAVLSKLKTASLFIFAESVKTHQQQITPETFTAINDVLSSNATNEMKTLALQVVTFAAQNKQEIPNLTLEIAANFPQQTTFLLSFYASQVQKLPEDMFNSLATFLPGARQYDQLNDIKVEDKKYGYLLCTALAKQATKQGEHLTLTSKAVINLIDIAQDKQHYDVSTRNNALVALVNQTPQEMIREVSQQLRSINILEDRSLMTFRIASELEKNLPCGLESIDFGTLSQEAQMRKFGSDELNFLSERLNSATPIQKQIICDTLVTQAQNFPGNVLSQLAIDNLIAVAKDKTLDIVNVRAQAIVSLMQTPAPLANLTISKIIDVANGSGEDFEQMFDAKVGTGATEKLLQNIINHISENFKAVYNL